MSTESVREKIALKVALARADGASQASGKTIRNVWITTPDREAADQILDIVKLDATKPRQEN